MADIELTNVSKRFGDLTVVNNVSLSVKDGEFLALVGPSGCGKSTMLRMISGLETMDDGDIKIGEEVVTNLSPKNRDIAMVFQNYALYPHMSVSENLSFGLKMKGFKKNEIENMVQETADLLDITELLERKPKQLSGGQKQRVAVGRAIIRNPKAFLFDEPLSNLDAKLRVKMRTDLLRLHKKQKATSIYVTHDQIEAMTMADRIAIINKGVIQQVDTPLNVYNSPKNLFVAGFIGSPSMNFISGEIILENGGAFFKTLTGNIFCELPDSLTRKIPKSTDKNFVLGIRPEDILLNPNQEQSVSIQSLKIELLEHMGDVSLLHIDPEEGLNWTVKIPPLSAVIEGEKVSLHLAKDKLHLFDAETGENLTL